MQISRYWQSDHEAVKDFAASLDTAVGFLSRGRPALSGAQPEKPVLREYRHAGHRLNQNYYFNDLAAYTWCSNLTVSFHDDVQIAVKGDAISPQGFTLNSMTLGILWGGEGSAL